MNLHKLLTFIIFIALLAGCGHNITTYSKGAGAQFSWNPQSSIVPTVRVGFYEALMALNKENAHTRYSTNLGAGIGNDIFGIASLYSMITGKTTNNNLGSGTVIEIRTQQMTNGYVRDVLTNPNINENHVRIAEQMFRPSSGLSDKETKVTSNSTETNLTPTVKTVKTPLTTSVTTPTNDYTQDAIKQQVKAKGWIDAIYEWGVYIIGGFFALMIIVIIMFIYKRKKKTEILR